MMTTAESDFNRYQDDALIHRCSDYARWTLPSVFPEFLHVGTGNQIVQYDYQSMGAMLVNRLSTKLAQVLFPTNTSFFKFKVMNDEELSDEQKIDLSNLELKACAALFDNAAYAQLVQAIRLLVVTGNCLVIRRDGVTRVLNLHNYALRRNANGKVLRIITKESLQYRELSQNIKDLLNINPNFRDDSEVPLYTVINRVSHETANGIIDTWEVHQEIQGLRVPDSEEEYPEMFCPYIPVVWNLSSGDNYGRGQVEDYAGDFIKLSELSAALASYELESTNIKYLYAPNSMVDVESFVNAASGEIIQGDPSAIQAFEAGQYNKIQALTADINSIFQRLTTAFLYTSNQRDAERVTAYEIQLAAMEAEQVLGGVYSQLSQGLHLPMAFVLSAELDPSFVIAYISGTIDLRVVTGMQALGRAAETQQWLLMGQELGTLVPVLTQVSPRFNTEKIIDRFMLAHGLNTVDVMLTEKELEAKLKQQQEQQAQMQVQQRQITGTDSTVDAAEQLGNI